MICFFDSSCQISEKPVFYEFAILTNFQLSLYFLLSQFWDIKTLAFRRYLCSNERSLLSSEYALIREPCWGRHFFGGFFVSSSGNVTGVVIREYIETQDMPKPDGDFNCTVGSFFVITVRIVCIFGNIRNFDSNQL